MGRLQQFSDGGVHISCELPFGEDKMWISWTMTIPFFNIFFKKSGSGVFFFPLGTWKHLLQKWVVSCHYLGNRWLFHQTSIHLNSAWLLPGREPFARGQFLRSTDVRADGWRCQRWRRWLGGWDFLLLSIGSWLFDRDPYNGLLLI